MYVFAVNDTHASTVDKTNAHTRTHTAHLVWGLRCISLLGIQLSVLVRKRHSLKRCQWMLQL